MKKLLIVAIILLPTLSSADECRSTATKHQFDKLMGFPHGRKGYVVDHVCALAVGGIDDVKNMQYQSIAEGHIKDRIELTKFGHDKYCNAQNSTATRQVFNCK